MSTVSRTSAPTFPVISANDLAEWVRIDPTSDQATVNMLLDSAVEIVEGLTGLTIMSATYQEVFTGCELSAVLPLSLSPVTSVSNVSITCLTTVADNLFQVGMADPITVFVEGDLPTDVVAITVTYTAGYASVDLIPAPIRHAIAVLVAAGYDARSALDPATMETVKRLIARYRTVTL